jgi:hypothetical protein
MEKNPQSVAKEFTPPPLGENVLGATMMAELIVTKKKIAPQLPKSIETSWASPKSSGAGGQRLPLVRRHGAEHCIFGPWVCGALGGGVRCHRSDAVEKKIRTNTAAWIRM